MTKIRNITSLMLAMSASCPLACAEDWPTFRGSDRTGVSPDTGLIDSLDADGPKLVFTAKGAGRGYASPAVADGKMITLGDGSSTASDDAEYLMCFDAETGDQLWMTKTGPAWNNGKPSWQGSRGTPTIDGDMVYVVTPHGKLHAARVTDGTVVWTRDLKEDFGGKKKDSWGYSESPLIDGDKLICTPGGAEATVVALEKATGNLIWKCTRPEDPGAGHSSVVISHVGGRKIYVQNTGGGPLGIDADTGAMLWEYDISPPTAFIPTPILDGDYVFTVAGYGTGGALLKQVAKGDSIAVEEVYGLQTDLGNKHGGVVLIDGKLYYGKEDKNVVSCADMATGEVLWSSRGSGSNSIAIGAADGKLFLRFESGELTLAEASPTGYKPLGTFKVPQSGGSNQPSWAHPVIANKRLYLRENDYILCYDISK